MHFSCISIVTTLLPLSLSTPLPGPKAVVRPITPKIMPVAYNPTNFHVRSTPVYYKPASMDNNGYLEVKASRKRSTRFHERLEVKKGKRDVKGRKEGRKGGTGA